MKLNILSLAAVLFLAQWSSPLISAKVFNKCSLVQELRRLGVPNNELSDWVCIAQHESSFNSKAVGKRNSDGTQDFGLFQINNKYWCKGSIKSSNTCKVSCNSLLSDNISSSVKCARTIKRVQGFKAWVAWNNKCQRNKPNVSGC